MTFKIRKVGRLSSTNKTLTSLNEKIFPHDPGFSEPRAMWWIVYNSESMPVGFAGVSMQSHGRAFLCRCGLLPEARGHGLQRRLIRLREAYCRKYGVITVVTYVNRENLHSANNLIKEGYLIYIPKAEWGLPVADATYFKKELQRCK